MPISKQSSRKNTASSRSKYHNIRSGQSASRKEEKRKRELEILERCGTIRNLRCQVPFELIPAQREPPTIGKRGGIKPGKCIERKVVYYADFTYIDAKTGELVVEDVKGYRGGGAYEVFTLKRKMMLSKYGIRIREV